MEPTRCGWAAHSEAMQRYHDEEWGVPRFDDAGQFEFLTLEAAQAGLSWSTILNKREGYRRCFANFDPTQVANFTPADVERLMLDPGIVRNRKKIESAVSNARLFLDIAARHGSFCALCTENLQFRQLITKLCKPDGHYGQRLCCGIQREQVLHGTLQHFPIIDARATNDLAMEGQSMFFQQRQPLHELSRMGVSHHLYPYIRIGSVNRDI